MKDINYDTVIDVLAETVRSNEYVITSYREEVEQLRSENVSLTNKANTYHDAINQLEAEVRRLKAENEIMEQTVGEYQSVASELSAENETLKEKLEEKIGDLF